MQDRDIVCDLMVGAKASISSYTMAIVETSNQQLRSTWQTLRNEAEQMHYQLYQMAEQKGYYMPAPPAHDQDIQKIKSGLSQSLTHSPQGTNNQSNIYSSAGTSSVNINNPTMASSVSQGMTGQAMANTSMNNMSSQMTSDTSQSMQSMTTNLGKNNKKNK